MEELAHYHKIFPPFAEVYTKGQKKNVQPATLVFVSGLPFSFINEKLLKDVKHTYVKDPNHSVPFLSYFVTMGFFNTVSELLSELKFVKIWLKGKRNRKKYIEVEVTAIPIPNRSWGIPIVPQSLLKEFEHLDLGFNFERKEKNDNKIDADMYIGQDLYWTLMRDNVFRPKNSKVVAQESVFGWLLSGNCLSENDTYKIW